MKVFADLHVHYYPQYSLNSFLGNIFSKLEGLSQNSQQSLGIIALTETKNCNFYQNLASAQLTLPAEYSLELLDNALLIKKETFSLVVIPGRQVNTLERIELLSLGSNNQVESGNALEETLKEIDSLSALAVLNWAPGKWWFQRGRILKNWISSSRKSRLICDTSLRPLGYSVPHLTRYAKKHKWQVIYGSDPLPDASEERNVFKYFACYNFSFDLTRPLDSFKDMLNAKPQIMGKRSSLIELFLRMYKYYSKK